MPTPQSKPNSLIVSVGVQTNVGKERTENQDRVTRAATPFGDLFVVADGVGGHQGGSEAAQAVVDGFSRFLNANGGLSLPEALQGAVRAISSDLQQRSATKPTLRGMGSTVVLCVLNGDRATYAHAGDSRAYLVRDHKLTQLTRDHSVMERMISQGILTPAQAREHPDSSVLTRAIGQSSDVVLDIAEIALQPGDALLLCSDGLWGYAKHEEMEAVATSESLSASAVATALLNLALEGGGGDNISIQFLRFESAKGRKASRSILGMSAGKAVSIVALVVIMAGGTVGLYVSNHSLAKPNIDLPEEAAPPPTPDIPGKSPKPAEHKEKAPSVPAPQNPKPAAPKNGATTPKVEVIVIEGQGKSVAEWAETLQDVEGVTTSRRSGSASCLAMEQEGAVLFHSVKTSDEAARIGNKIGISQDEIKLMTSDDLQKCGGGEILAMPAKPTLTERIHDRLPNPGSAIDAGKREAEKIGEKIKDKLPKPK
jgi:serine/threonine protein phosphatase PrpC